MTTSNTIKPKYFRKDSSVKTIEIQGKEWFDKVNGNSYNSVCVIVNCGMKNEASFSIPFQYGYGNYYEQSAFEYLVKLGFISDARDTQLNGKVEVYSGIECNHLKRDVKAHGETYTQV